MKKYLLCLFVSFTAVSLYAENLRDAKVKEIVDGNTITVRVIPT